MVGYCESMSILREKTVMYEDFFVLRWHRREILVARCTFTSPVDGECALSCSDVGVGSFRECVGLYVFD